MSAITAAVHRLHASPAARRRRYHAWVCFVWRLRLPRGGIQFFIVGFAFYCLCVVSLSAQPRSDGMSSYEQFEQTIQSYPYKASAERTAKVKAGLTLVRWCMAKSGIQTLLGAPDFSGLDFGPKGPRERWLGSHWTYYLSKQWRGVNENDSSVTVYFDTKGFSHWVVPHHIDGAMEIGGVGVRCDFSSPSSPPSPAARP